VAAINIGIASVKGMKFPKTFSPYDQEVRKAKDKDLLCWEVFF